MTKVAASGPQPAKILIVGDFPSKTDEQECKIFHGSAGSELSKMLNEAGLLRTEIRLTNVLSSSPPGNDLELWWPEKKKNIRPNYVEVYGRKVDPRVEEGVRALKDEINLTNPNIIIPLGNLPLWVITGETGITKWRSSLLRCRNDFASAGSTPGESGQLASVGLRKVLPTFHPSTILLKWDWRYLAVHDLRRAARWSKDTVYPEIEEHFLVNPTFDAACITLKILLQRLEQTQVKIAVDIETRLKHLACIGLAWSKSDAICIPFNSNDRPEGFWTQSEELALILLLREVLTHRNALCIGQNWQYDYQYIAKYWGFEVNLFLDIMSEHHVQFAGLQKGLDFQSALYRNIHVYWKDDGKEQGHGDEVQWWTYNCRDCVSTYEIAEVLLHAREQRQLRATSYGSPHEIQQSLSNIMARCSARGIRLDHDLRGRMAFMLQENLREAEEWINKIVGYELNCSSPIQLQKLFYEELGQSKILDRKTRRPTTNADAMDTIAQRDILLRPLCSAINNIRSLSNYISVCLQPTDSDGRFRCQFTIPGTETYRFSTSSDPFGFGTNGQNITSGHEKDKDFPLPNIRKLLIPDPGMVMGEFDLPQADARVVAWEAEDESLIKLFEDPSRDLHNENCEIIFGSRPKDKYDIRRYYAKQGVHLTNYGGQPRVLAMSLGITMKEAEHFQMRWFSAHPKIREWHRKIEMQIATRRYVENAFGYRRFYFDRIDGILKEALAWIPQSTVAIATNLGIIEVDRNETLRKLNNQLLLQVHDSSLFQWPKMFTPVVLPLLRKCLTITVPYSYPLVFAAGAKISDKSWGECDDIK